MQVELCYFDVQNPSVAFLRVKARIQQGLQGPPSSVPLTSLMICPITFSLVYSTPGTWVSLNLLEPAKQFGFSVLRERAFFYSLQNIQYSEQRHAHDGHLHLLNE